MKRSAQSQWHARRAWQDDARGVGRTIDLPEHFPHALDVIQVKEPSLGVAVVLLEGNLCSKVAGP